MTSSPIQDDICRSCSAAEQRSPHFRNLLSALTWKRLLAAGVTRVAIVSTLVLGLSSSLAQQPWVAFQEPGSREALYIEDKDSVAFTSFVRLWTRSTFGDTTLWSGWAGSSREEGVTVSCTRWEWMGMLGQSLVFRSTTFTTTVERSGFMGRGAIALYEEAEPGTREAATSLYLLCSDGARTTTSTNRMTLYVPLRDNGIANVTPSTLWNKGSLSIIYYPETSLIGVDFTP